MKRIWKVARFALPLALMSTSSLAAPGAPPGWFSAGSRPQDYDMGTDAAPGTTGKQAAYIKAKADAQTDGFGTLMQCIKADNYIGRRLRLSARLRSVKAGKVQLWMRVDGEEGRTLGFYNMEDRPLQGSVDWKRVEAVLDVPTGSIGICYGYFLAGGQGEGWADGFSLTQVGREVPISRMSSYQATAPVNLGFDR